MTRSLSNRASDGFTLVEVLTVIVIIGILAGLAVPAIFTAIGTAKSGKMRLEVGTLDESINQYQQKYGDFPPDFSDWAVVERHYRKIFPRIAPGELNRLRVLTDVDPSNDTTTTFPPSGGWVAHNPAALDRGEAISWALGGYSSNPLLPFTGAGGPFEVISATSSGVLLHINADRENRLYDFDPTRLDYSEIDSAATLSAANRRLSSDGDLFTSYSAHDEGAPFVYFDSRTYTFIDLSGSAPPAIVDFNGYGSTDHGSIRPYVTDLAVAKTSTSNYPTLQAALGAWQFAKPDTFQIIAPGIDGNFGSVRGFEADSSQSITTGNSGAEPVYFQYPTGKAIAPTTQANAPGGLIISGVNRYQESAKFGGTEDPHQDNLTNFANAKLIDELKE